MTKESNARSRSYYAIKSKKIIPARFCETCGKKRKTEGHHRDYNKPLEVTWLCRRCHMIEDGRMEAIHAIDRHTVPKKCINCGKLSKPLRKGLCHNCNEYQRRQNKKRPYINDGRHEKTIIPYSKPCKRCGRISSIVGKPVKGFCASCYSFLWRKNKKKRLTIKGR